MPGAHVISGSNPDGPILIFYYGEVPIEGYSLLFKQILNTYSNDDTKSIASMIPNSSIFARIRHSDKLFSIAGKLKLCYAVRQVTEKDG